MAVTIDQAAIGAAVSSGVPASSITLTSNVAIAPNTLVVLIYGGDGPNNVTSVTGTNGLTWTIDKQSTNPTSTDRVCILSAPCVAGLASGVTFTVNTSANVASLMLGGISILGADLTASRVDGTPPAQVDTSAGGGWACASYSLAAGSILIAASEVDTSTSSGQAAGSTEFFDKNEAVSGNTTTAVYLVDAGSGGPTTAGGTFVATGTARTSIGVAYKAGSSAASGALAGPALATPLTGLRIPGSPPTVPMLPTGVEQNALGYVSALPATQFLNPLSLTMGPVIFPFPAPYVTPASGVNSAITPDAGIIATSAMSASVAKLALVAPAAVTASSTVAASVVKLALVKPAAASSTSTVAASVVALRAIRLASISSTSTVTANVVAFKHITVASVNATSTVTATVTKIGVATGVAGTSWFPLFG